VEWEEEEDMARYKAQKLEELWVAEGNEGQAREAQQKVIGRSLQLKRVCIAFTRSVVGGASI
jgi:hypothetical protein